MSLAFVAMLEVLVVTVPWSVLISLAFVATFALLVVTVPWSEVMSLVFVETCVLSDVKSLDVTKLLVVVIDVPSGNTISSVSTVDKPFIECWLCCMRLI